MPKGPPTGDLLPKQPRKKETLTEYCMRIYADNRTELFLTYVGHGFGACRFLLVALYAWPLAAIGYLARKWEDPFSG